MSEVTIIIVNYKTKELTIQCINSIYEKTKGVSFDVIVVDNKSDDGSVELIKKQFPNVKIIGNDINSGFGKANNIAIRTAKTKYVFLLNSDTILLNDAVSIMYDYMEKNSSVGACGGQLYCENHNKTSSYGKFLTIKERILSIFISTKKLFGKNVYLGYDNCELPHEVDFIIGADLMLRKSVIDEIGMFDEDFFLYFEESELQYRIRKGNYNIFILPDAKIIHFGSKSFNDRKVKREEYLKSEYLYYKKCYKLSKYSIFKIIYMSTLLLRLLVTPKMIIRVYKYILSL